METDKFILISSEGYHQLVNPIDGANYNWTTSSDVELPIKLNPSGPGSEIPITMCE
jgi:hypothetical protein